jgi:uncharacterized protein (TIGR00106 family)
MYVILSFTLVPINAGMSLSKYVAETERILEKSGLTYKLHANGTNVEGDWDEVMDVIKKCQISVHEMGAERIFTTIQLGTRTDKDQTMDDKIRSVKEKI